MHHRGDGDAARQGNPVAKTETNTFGDFKFDGLDEESGAYSIEISHARFSPKTVEFNLGASLNLGTIQI